MLIKSSCGCGLRLVGRCHYMFVYVDYTFRLRHDAYTIIHSKKKGIERDGKVLCLLENVLETNHMILESLSM